MADQAKTTSQAEQKPAESKPKPAPIPRTAVKTRRIGLGQYTSLNGQVRASRNEDGKGWRLAKRDGSEWTALKRDYRTSNEALTGAVTEHGFKLDELNTAPAKPKAAKPGPQKAEEKAEAKEEGTNERRRLDRAGTREAENGPPACAAAGREGRVRS
jgi:hypothetical protein